MSITHLFKPFLLLMTIPILAQTGISLGNPETAIDHRFEFEVNKYVFDKIYDITGEKLKVQPDQVLFNDKPLNVKSCKTRGNTTLNYRRKSFSLSLHDHIDFQGVPAKRLAINNLAMDQNYWRARLCFMLMDQIGIFPLKNQFTELVINGQTQGTYLMIQKPEDYCREISSSLLVRRDDSRQFKVEFADNPETKKTARHLRKVTELTKHYSGVQLYDTLAQIVDLNAYEKWLAFNFLIMNGDYTDELFLFLAPETGRFRIIPWDYDDIFAEQPHEGQQQRDHKFGNQLLFSSEASFDQVIAQDEYLYQEYLKVFHQMISTITPELLKKSFEQVYNELYPYFSDPEIIAQSQFDLFGRTNIDLLREDLKLHHEFLLDRRNSIEAALVMAIDN